MKSFCIQLAKNFERNSVQVKQDFLCDLFPAFLILADLFKLIYVEEEIELKVVTKIFLQPTTIIYLHEREFHFLIREITFESGYLNLIDSYYYIIRTQSQTSA